MPLFSNEKTLFSRLNAIIAANFTSLLPWIPFFIHSNDVKIAFFQIYVHIAAGRSVKERFFFAVKTRLFLHLNAVNTTIFTTKRP